MGEPNTRSLRIREALVEHLDADHVEVIDDSARHAGHPGSQDGTGHFRIIVVSARFEGASRVQAQRLVYEALGDMMANDIHALQMRTLSPAEWRQLQQQAD